MASNSSKATRYVFLIAGILLLGASGMGLWFHGKDAMKLWQLQHAPPPAKGKTAPAQPPTEAVMKIYSYVAGEIIGLFLGIGLILKSAQKEKTGSGETVEGSGPAIEADPVHKPKPVAAARRWQTCNILEPGLDKRRLWSFVAGKSGFTLVQQQNVAIKDPLPVKEVGRDWKNLLQPKLNIAWLPTGQVFLRVLQLPVGELDEMMSMVELQLEKISPIPVTQIVWTAEVLPQKKDNLQTVVVVIVGRDVVENFLGELESQGFLPDRLEYPLLDLILNTRVSEDGAYVFPSEIPGAYAGVVAWWYGGVLRELGLLHLEANPQSQDQLREQLAQMAWSGQLDGWLKNSPTFHIVASNELGQTWAGLFAPWSEKPAQVIKATADPLLATFSADRASRRPVNTGILPFEYVTRYTQEFHDRLWMRLLFVLVGFYVLAVIGYMGAVQVRGLSADQAELQRSSLATQYTNTMKIKAQLEILQNREALKFAALDCWKVAARLLPDDVTIQSMDFRDGKIFSISGVAPADKNEAITEFNANLRKATLHDQQMFERVDLPQIKLNPGNVTLTWNFSCELARAEELR